MSAAKPLRAQSFQSFSLVNATNRSVVSAAKTIGSYTTLTSLTATVQAGTPRRESFCRIQLEDANGNVIRVLARGYVDIGGSIQGFGALGINPVWRVACYGKSSVASTILITYSISDVVLPAGTWTGTNEGSTEGQGAVKVAQIAQPAPATELTVTVPTNARWKLKSFQYSFSTSSTVSTRRATLAFNYTGFGNFIDMPSVVTQAAGVNARQYHYSSSPIADVNVLDVYVRIPIVDNLLTAGEIINTNTYNLQMGDQLSAATYQVDEWLEE